MVTTNKQSVEGISQLHMKMNIFCVIMACLSQQRSDTVTKTVSDYTMFACD